MTNRLFTAVSLTTSRMTKKHWSDHANNLACWASFDTYNYLMDSENPALLLLSLYENPIEYDLKLSFTEPVFYDDSEHFYISLDYHEEDKGISL